MWIPWLIKLGSPFYAKNTISVWLFIGHFSDLRLSGFAGSPTYAGRVEIYYNGEWGTVCDDRWDIDDAHVVCRQLGFPKAITALQGDQIPAGVGKIWLDEVKCSGTEHHIANCSHNGWDLSDCFHTEDAGVICERGRCCLKPRPLLLKKYLFIDFVRTLKISSSLAKIQTWYSPKRQHWTYLQSLYDHKTTIEPT